MPRPPRTPPADAARRRLLSGAGGTLVLSLSPFEIAHGARLLGVRVWPAAAYTRVTIEHDTALSFTHFMVRETPPLRLVVDIDGMELTPALAELVRKVEPDDPYIARVRVGQNRPRVVRIVFDLKEDIAPEVFALDPAGPYQRRLVLDLYPVNAPDPLLALLREHDQRSRQAAAAAPAAPEVAQPPAALPGPDAPLRGAPAASPGLPTREREVDELGQLAEAAAQRSSRSASRRGENVARIATVAIDPGHGGEDPGAIGRRGTLEKHVTLSIAQRLARMIDAEPNMRAVLTRDGDFFVPLGTRVAKARRVQADLFVSVHADAWIRPDARGSSVFALSERGATSSAAAWMARRENESDAIGGVNLGSHDPGVARVLLDLSTTAQIRDSLMVGNAVLREIERVNRLHKPRVEQAGFAVLKAPDVPSILIETAFISNPDEELRLQDEAYQRQIAAAILGGIRRYFRANPPRARARLG